MLEARPGTIPEFNGTARGNSTSFKDVEDGSIPQLAIDVEQA
jgi:hypothetical protein